VSAVPVAILKTGLVSSVGFSAPAACAAIRAGVTNPTQTRFMDSYGAWINAHAVPLQPAVSGLGKLTSMVTMAIAEALQGIVSEEWARIPLLLCVAERERPGRLSGLDAELFDEVRARLQTDFATDSLVIPHGRVSVGVALMHARRLIVEGTYPLVLIAATDSLITGSTLDAYERERRLLTEANSNGFMAGEGAGALLVGPAGSGPALVCTGLGFASEPAHIGTTQPLRADGLTQAIKAALADAGQGMEAIDFRITDVSGEQYYFKEAALALTRTLRVRKEEFDIWHPAECIGEVGAVAGAATIAVADAACRKSYAAGPNILVHLANDFGQRAAAVLRFGVN
jgi:3-oxoacyl-[acyl-carrier-protein] synthase I